jgi:hypothetical protein
MKDIQNESIRWKENWHALKEGTINASPAVGYET